MKTLKYYLCITFFFCGCTDAAPKEKETQYTCPYILPAEKDFSPSWVTIGKVTSDKVQLRQIDIIDGNAIEEKNRVSKEKERVFSADIIDEWNSVGDRSEATAEYPENHREMSIMCTYGKTIADANDENKNVVLLVPLPIKKAVNCLLVRRDVDPTHEVSCKVK